MKEKDIHIIFNDAYEKYGSDIYLNICKWIKDQSVAEDIFQDVFTSLWQSLKNDKEIKSTKAWLYVTSHHAAMQVIKQKIKTQTTLFENAQTFEFISDNTVDFTIKEDKYKILETAITELSPKRREAFVSYKVDGLSIQEIANKMDISPLSVRLYIKQSLSIIKKQVRTHKWTITSIYLFVQTMLSK